MDYNIQAKFRYNENYVAWKYWSYPFYDFLLRRKWNVSRNIREIISVLSYVHVVLNLFDLIGAIYLRWLYDRNFMQNYRTRSEGRFNSEANNWNCVAPYPGQKEQCVFLVLLWFTPRNKKHANSFDRGNVCFATRTTSEAQTVFNWRNVRTRYARMRERRTKFTFGLRHTVKWVCTKRIIITQSKHTYCNTYAYVPVKVHLQIDGRECICETWKRKILRSKCRWMWIFTWIHYVDSHATWYCFSGILAGVSRYRILQIRADVCDFFVRLQVQNTNSYDYLFAL